MKPDLVNEAYNVLVGKNEDENSDARKLTEEKAAKLAVELRRYSQDPITIGVTYHKRPYANFILTSKKTKLSWMELKDWDTDVRNVLKKANPNYVLLTLGLVSNGDPQYEHDQRFMRTHQLHISVDFKD